MSQYLIVGASSGIGEALTKILVEDGHQVTGTYHKNTPEFQHPHVTYQSFDVTAQTIGDSEIPETLDGFVYCPGSINLLPFSRIKTEDFVSDYELQVVGAISMLQSLLPSLRQSDQASVVFFSTVAVQTGFNFHSQVAASKGAIEGLTRSLAAEFAPKIRVNAIAPSLTQTRLAAKLLGNEQKVEANAERHPLKRVGQADDIAQMASFLLSEKSSWISGQILAVDGGMSSLRV